MKLQRWTPTVTVAAIIEAGGRYLLVEEQTADGLRLNNPAGHLEPGESPTQGVVREVLEETACRFTPEALVGVYLVRIERAANDAVTYLRLAFCGQVSAPIEGRALDAPVVRTLWLTLDEIRSSRARHRSPLVLECIEDHARGLRHDLGLLRVHPSAVAPGAGPLG